MTTQDDSLELTAWVKRGSMIIARDALPVDDPESWPTKWQEKFGDLDGFPWRKAYGDAATEARAEWNRKMRRKHGDCDYCPQCGYQLW